jgi:hypothetical protein
MLALPAPEEGSEDWSDKAKPRTRKQRIDILGTPFNPAEVKQPRAKVQASPQVPGARAKAKAKAETDRSPLVPGARSKAKAKPPSREGIPQLIQNQLKTAKSKSMAKPPEGKYKRYVQRGVDTEMGRGLIHVPDPVLPHNDVGNDPYLIKSQHNNISA